MKCGLALSTPESPRTWSEMPILWPHLGPPLSVSWKGRGCPWWVTVRWLEVDIQWLWRRSAGVSEISGCGFVVTWALQLTSHPLITVFKRKTH